MNFPYGNSDFDSIIADNYVYLDRTDRIPQLEKSGRSLLFLRPRRFGKSLLLSMLENYYDVAKADDFDHLFGHLAIGENPTPLHNQYLVMRWDFSAISSKGTYEEQVNAIHQYVNGEIRAFSSKYQTIFPQEIELHPTNCISSLWAALSMVQKTEYKLYLLVDEYDNFANEILMSSREANQARYEDLLFGEGEFKTLFKAIKAAMAGRGLDRTFIVGVSPIVLHDVSSGYNIAENIYLQEEFNDLCGFTELEVTQLLRAVAEACKLSESEFEEALELMRIYYNGSLFSEEGGESIYNPTSTFYFLKYLQRTCKYPRNLLDSNLAPDQDKIAYISRLLNGEKLIFNVMDEAEPPSISRLEDRFGMTQMLEESQSESFMLSLLYYLGVLTLSDRFTISGQQILRIPNLIMQQLYADQIRKMWLPNGAERDLSKKAAQALYSDSQTQPMQNFIEQKIFPVFDNRDYIQANELSLKTLFISLLYDDTFYMIDSERPLRRGYADLTMILRPEMRRYQLFDLLFEFKFIKLQELGLSGNEVSEKSNDELRDLEIVQSALSDARIQIDKYRPALEEKYGEKLKLHCYIVISVGFEKIFWEEIA